MLLYYWIYQTCCKKVIKCLASLAFYPFSPICLIKSIIHVRSCKILDINHCAPDHMIYIATRLLSVLTIKRDITQEWIITQDMLLSVPLKHLKFAVSC